MASAERGTKRQCIHCGTKYYDLNRDPILCPVCEKPYEPPAEVKPRKSTPDDAAPVKEAPADSTEVVADPAAAQAGAQVVSFEEAEKETDDDDNEDTGEDIPDVEGVEDIGGEVDNSFVEGDDDDDNDEIGLGVKTTGNED